MRRRRSKSYGTARTGRLLRSVSGAVPFRAIFGAIGDDGRPGAPGDRRRRWRQARELIKGTLALFCFYQPGAARERWRTGKRNTVAWRGVLLRPC